VKHKIKNRSHKKIDRKTQAVTTLATNSVESDKNKTNTTKTSKKETQVLRKG